MIEYRHIGWWYWLGMVILLAVGLSGLAEAFSMAIMLGTVQIIHFVMREHSAKAFSVQVRIAYLGLLILGQLEAMHWVYWVQMVGTSARVLTGYCLLARTVSLLPWNRSQPLSRPLVYRTYVSLHPGMISCMGVRPDISNVLTTGRY